MAAQKKVPLRQCIGCREMKSKKEMIRVIRTPEQKFMIDPSGKMNGRGAYVCPCSDCLERAIKTHGLERSFACQIPAEVYEQLKEEMRAIEKR